MKIAFIHIQDFPVQVEILDNPALRQTAVVIGGLPSGEGTVYACSRAARIDGVQLGMTLRQAEQLSPRATFLPLSRDLYDRAHKTLLGTLSPYSPFRESSAPGRIYLDASGLERLYGSDDELVKRILRTIRDELNLLPQIGLAANKFTAETAARLSDPGAGQVVSPGTEREFLAPLPLILLPSSDDTYRLLGRLGLETIGQVAEMPVGGLSRTFGKEGLLLHSHGQDSISRMQEDQLGLRRAQPAGEAQVVLHEAALKREERLSKQRWEARIKRKEHRVGP